MTLVRRRLANLLLVLVSLALVLGIAELALRLTDFSYVTASSVAQFPPGYFRSDPEMGVDHAPDQPPQLFSFRGPGHEVFTNSAGCFDQDRDIVDGYILAIGDSATWGWSPLATMWTSLLETNSGVTVVKCGVAGTGPRHQLIKAQRVVEQLGARPRAIIVSYTFSNDFNDDVFFPGYALLDGRLVDNLKSFDILTGGIERLDEEEIEARYERFVVGRASFRRWLRTTFVTLGLVGHVYDTRLQQIDANRPLPRVLHSRYERNLLEYDVSVYPWVGTAFAAHIENIRALARFASEIGAEFVVIGRGEPGSESGHRLEHFFLREVLHYHNISEYIQRHADGRATRYRFDGHANALGNRLAAEAISQYLADAGII